MRRDFNTEQFGHFVEELQESFWGDFQGRTRRALEAILKADSEQQMERYLGLKWHERPAEGEGRIDYRNGSYVRNYVTPLGGIQVQVSRTRKRSFMPGGIKALERRSPEVAELIRQAFLRGISTRAVGRVVALLTEEPVSAQTVSRLTRVLDQAVQTFHTAPLNDDWAYLILDGVWMKVRRSFGPQRVLLLVAYGVRPNGERCLLAFMRARGESQAAWEGFLFSLVERGLRGQHLQLIITDGCPGETLAEMAVRWLVKQYAEGIGVKDGARRTCARLRRKSGGDLEQMQMLLGHASIQATEKYLGVPQNLVEALNDKLGIFDGIGSLGSKAE